jgi:prepilin-type N-terminal cleavage/methylation domain-containing protein
VRGRTTGRAQNHCKNILHAYDQIMNPHAHTASRPASARGFTLIELLVVIAIIAILAAML